MPKSVRRGFVDLRIITQPSEECVEVFFYRAVLGFRAAATRMPKSVQNRRNAGPERYEQEQPEQDHYRHLAACP
jgi:hypothetical protein